MSTDRSQQAARLAVHAARVAERNREASARVSALARQQATLNRQLAADLGSLQAQSTELDAIERAAAERGVLASLSRALSRRRDLLARRAVSEALQTQFGAVNLGLRRADAFNDELRLTALELQNTVVELHAERAEAVTQLGQDRAALAAADDASRAPDLSPQIADHLRFERRQRALNVELLEAELALAADQIQSAAHLRDLVMDLHEGMSRLLVQASAAAMDAGRRIQALAQVADAPAVIEELRISLGALGATMVVTEQRVGDAERALRDVLPGLNAALEAQSPARRLLDLSADASSAMAADPLRAEAEAEVESAVVDGLRRRL